jgi:hypothetical protein
LFEISKQTPYYNVEKTRAHTRTHRDKKRHVHAKAYYTRIKQKKKILKNNKKKNVFRKDKPVRKFSTENIRMSE